MRKYRRSASVPSSSFSRSKAANSGRSSPSWKISDVSSRRPSGKSCRRAAGGCACSGSPARPRFSSRPSPQSSAAPTLGRSGAIPLPGPRSRHLPAPRRGSRAGGRCRGRRGRRHRLRPERSELQQRRRHGHPLQAEVHRRPARHRGVQRPRECPGAGRPPVRGRHPRAVPGLLRPELGQGRDQVDHQAGDRKPRVPERHQRRRLLGLLQRRGRPERPRRRARPGLLQLRRGRLARDRAQLDVQPGPVRPPARRRSSGCGPTSRRIRTRAPSPTGTTRCGTRGPTATTTTRRSTPRRCGRRCTRTAPSSSSTGMRTPTSASPRRTRTGTRIRRRESASSSSGPAARASASPARSSRTARGTRTTTTACSSWC